MVNKGGITPIAYSAFYSALFLIAGVNEKDEPKIMLEKVINKLTENQDLAKVAAYIVAMSSSQAFKLMDEEMTNTLKQHHKFREYIKSGDKQSVISKQDVDVMLLEDAKKALKKAVKKGFDVGFSYDDKSHHIVMKINKDVYEIKADVNEVIEELTKVTPKSQRDKIRKVFQRIKKQIKESE
jgi:hypothetical protein